MRSCSFLHTKSSNSYNNLLLRMAILTESRYVSYVFSYSLAYLTLKYARNGIFHPCGIMFDFYRRTLLKPCRDSRDTIYKINCLNCVLVYSLRADVSYFLPPAEKGRLRNGVANRVPVSCCSGFKFCINYDNRVLFSLPESFPTDRSMIGGRTGLRGRI